MVKRILDHTGRPIIREPPVTPLQDASNPEVSNASGPRSTYAEDAYTTEGQTGLPPVSSTETSPTGEVEPGNEASFPAWQTPFQDPALTQPQLTSSEIVAKTTAAIEQKNGTTGLMLMIDQMRLRNQEVKRALGGVGGSASSTDTSPVGSALDLDLLRPQNGGWSDSSYRRFKERYDVSDDAYEEHEAAVAQEAVAQEQDYLGQLEEEHRLEEEEQRQEMLDAQDQS